MNASNSDQSTRIAIRPATLEDARAIANLTSQWGYAMAADRAETCLLEMQSDPRHIVYVANIDQGDIAGWIHVHERVLISTETMAEISGLIVDETRRKNGVGRALVEAAEDWTASRGISKLVVKSNAIRPEAHLFYPAVGFELVKTQRSYAKELG